MTRQALLTIEPIASCWARLVFEYETVGEQPPRSAVGEAAENHILIWAIKIVANYLETRGAHMLARAIESLALQVDAAPPTTKDAN